MKKIKLDPDIIEYDGKGFKKVVKNEDDFWNRLKDIQNEIDTDIFNKHKCENCGEEKPDVKSRGDGEYLLYDDCLNNYPNETGYCSISCRISGNCDGVVKMSKSEIEKIKAVLSDLKNADIEDYVLNLTKALEIAVEALYYFDYEELYNGSVNQTDKSTHAEYAKDKIKQISEILESK